MIYENTSSGESLFLRPFHLLSVKGVFFLLFFRPDSPPFLVGTRVPDFRDDRWQDLSGCFVGLVVVVVGEGDWVCSP